MHKLNELDFSSATNELNEVLYDVKLISVATSTGESLFDGIYDNIKASNYKAVVNTKSKNIICIVTNNYNLITNQQALDMGKKAFKQLFPSIKTEELIPYKVISPKSKSYCFIDLIHKKVNFNVWEQETWLPFIRVINSYNRTYALTFELGFVRKVCSNGVIFDKKTIKVKYSHSEGIPIDISADVSKLKILEADFINHLTNLKRFYIKPEHVFALLCKSLDLKFNFENKNNNPFLQKQIEKYENLKKLTAEKSKMYLKKDGDNVFAAFNVITDIISNQNLYDNLPNYSIRANGYYHKISNWMREFVELAESRDFKMEKYLEDFLN